eukprot:331203-Prymnesium_polylepis.1
MLQVHSAVAQAAKCMSSRALSLDAHEPRLVTIRQQKHCIRVPDRPDSDTPRAAHAPSQHASPRHRRPHVLGLQARSVRATPIEAVRRGSGPGVLGALLAHAPAAKWRRTGRWRRRWG